GFFPPPDRFLAPAQIRSNLFPGVQATPGSLGVCRRKICPGMPTPARVQLCIAIGTLYTRFSGQERRQARHRFSPLRESGRSSKTGNGSYTKCKKQELRK